MREINAIFANDSVKATAYPHLWQWDYGRILTVSGLTLPEEYDVHICNEGEAYTNHLIGRTGGIPIPDSYLESGKDILIYIYLHQEDDDGITSYTVKIPVKKRPSMTVRQRFRQLFSEQVSVFYWGDTQDDISFGPYAYTPYPHDVPLIVEQDGTSTIFDMIDSISWNSTSYCPLPHEQPNINRQGMVFDASEPIDILDWASESYDPDHRGAGMTVRVKVVYDHCAQLQKMGWAGSVERGLDGE